MPKQEKPKKPRTKNTASRVPYSASMQECTGLMPTLADDEYEIESYQELFSYESPEMDEDEW